MAKQAVKQDTPRNPAERKVWLYFMAFRASCALVALAAALNFSLFDSVLVAAGLMLVLMVVESIYKSTLYWMRKHEQQLAEQRRRQRAEAERLAREREFREAQRESAEKYFDPGMLTLGQGHSAARPSQ